VPWLCLGAFSTIALILQVFELTACFINFPFVAFVLFVALGIGRCRRMQVVPVQWGEQINNLLRDHGSGGENCRAEHLQRVRKARRIRPHWPTCGLARSRANAVEHSRLGRLPHWPVLTRPVTAPHYARVMSPAWANETSCRPHRLSLELRRERPPLAPAHDTPPPRFRVIWVSTKPGRFSSRAKR
jgi:hypothetical protein